MAVQVKQESKLSVNVTHRVTSYKCPVSKKGGVWGKGRVSRWFPYVRKCEMKEFAEFDISPWILCDAPASLRRESNFFVFQFHSHSRIIHTLHHTNTNANLCPLMISY
ncbi:hypothetical protein AMECASPLE_011583 [Ameca splendens]|uniref:Uncharacterized protein n=1 Tax=Ameca splendens TaxID=208324 RepID=A0ABV0XDW4_9TELE